jgi:hypothetical protein
MSFNTRFNTLSNPCFLNGNATEHFLPGPVYAVDERGNTLEWPRLMSLAGPTAPAVPTNALVKPPPISSNVGMGCPNSTAMWNTNKQGHFCQLVLD